MATTQTVTAAPSTLHLVDQKAGNRSILVANARDVIITQLYHHPRLLFVLLLLAIFALCIVLAVGTSLVGVKGGFFQSLVGVVCSTTGFIPADLSNSDAPTPSPIPASATPEPTAAPAPDGGLISDPAASTDILQCTVAADGLNVRVGPGATTTILEELRQATPLAPLGRNENGTWLNVQVVASDTIGWVASAYVSCSIPVESLPVIVVSTDALPVITPTDAPPVITPTDAPPVITPTDAPPVITAAPRSESELPGSWRGTTDQGEVITFRVEPDGVGYAAVDLAVAFQFEPACPIGKVTFTSRSAAHIFGPPAPSFTFLGLTEPDASAFLEGGITGTTAAGTLQVTDTRNPDEKFANPCKFSTTIKWTAAKQ